MEKKALGLALGTNLGNRMANLRAAIQGIVSFCGNRSIIASSIFETIPVDCPVGSETFYNAVIQVNCCLEPQAVLARCQAVELELGRPLNHERHAPRTIDIDILYYDDLKMAEGNLKIPHPGIAERRFVLQPLCEIRPGLILPGSKKSIEEILASLQSCEPNPQIIYPKNTWL